MNVNKLFDLSGRVAIVAGGIRWAWPANGGRPWRNGRESRAMRAKKERCEQAAEELQQVGVKTLALGCDVKDPASIQAVAEDTFKQFGRIDILINNAGTSWGTPVEAMTLEQWNKVIETNLTGTFLFSQAVGKVMIAQRRGKIINIASVAGLRGSPPSFSAIGYSASKGGVIIFTRDLACKWGIHNIQVNAIAPGWFPTNMSGKIIERNKEMLLAGMPAGQLWRERMI